MATTARLYRKPQPEPQTFVAADPGGVIKLRDDLLHLEAEGLLVSFRDEHGVVRYRTIRIKEAA